MTYMRFVAILGLILAFTSYSCGSKTTNTTNTNNLPNTDSIQTQMYVWAENALMRSEPNQKAKIVDTIPAGFTVILLGEKSKEKEKIKIRGVEFDDYWYQTTLNDGTNGWMFGGLLTNDLEKAKNLNNFNIVPGESVGIVKVGMKVEELKNIIGKEFVQEGKIMMGEGTEVDGVFIFKGTSLEIEATVNKSKIEQIILTKPGAPYHTEDNIKVGTALETLVKINQKPIDFYGFGWDYAGTIDTYNGGNLSKFNDKLFIVLGEPNDLTNLDDFIGDFIKSTKDKRILNKGCKVVEIRIGKIDYDA